MYLNHFGLTEAPFSIAPDPRYLYLSQRHQEALAHLLYGVRGDGGFVLLTGEVGTGKTTVCRCLLEQIPDTCDVAYVFNPKLTAEELLQTICVEFGIPVPTGNTSVKVFIDAINAYLLDAHARGRQAVLIIDEAQNLSADVLEQMRLLTNLETNRRKLLQIILIGQPELATMLARPQLRQLAQRIVARYHLGALTRDETAAYVRHRLQVSGARQEIVPAALTGRLQRLSGGIPRVINLLCDRALLGAYAQGKPRVDGATLARAAKEVLDSPPAAPRRLWKPMLAGALLVAAGILAVTRVAPDRPVGPVDGVESIAVAAPRPAEPRQAVPDTPPSATLDWPAGEPRSRSRALAMAALLGAWGIADAGGEPCRQAEAEGLLCRSGRGSLEDLRQFNSPVVLSMRDGQGHEFQAPLTGLGDASATFVVAGQPRTVSLDTLASQWSGEYTLLWRMPPEARRKLRPGDRGPAVAWLADRLAVAQGRVPEKRGEAAFDAALVSQVRQFQLAQGLVPDGSAGPQTLIRIGALADPAAPKLFRDQGKH